MITKMFEGLFNVFNAIAPIAIYHESDAGALQEAKNGLRLISTRLQEGDAIFEEYFGKPTKSFSWQSSFRMDCFPNGKKAAEIYDQIFLDILVRYVDGWVPIVDDDGCQGFEVHGHRTTIFHGDCLGHFQFFMNAAEFVRRIESAVSIDECRSIEACA